MFEICIYYRNLKVQKRERRQVHANFFVCYWWKSIFKFYIWGLNPWSRPFTTYSSSAVGKFNFQEHDWKLHRTLFNLTFQNLDFSWSHWFIAIFLFLSFNVFPTFSSPFIFEFRGWVCTTFCVDPSLFTFFLMVHINRLKNYESVSFTRLKISLESFLVVKPGIGILLYIHIYIWWWC